MIRWYLFHYNNVANSCRVLNSCELTLIMSIDVNLLDSCQLMGTSYNDKKPLYLFHYNNVANSCRVFKLTLVMSIHVNWCEPHIMIRWYLFHYNNVANRCRVQNWCELTLIMSIDANFLDSCQLMWTYSHHVEYSNLLSSCQLMWTSYNDTMILVPWQQMCKLVWSSQTYSLHVNWCELTLIMWTHVNWCELTWLMWTSYNDKKPLYLFHYNKGANSCGVLKLTLIMSIHVNLT